ncbi:hypothetical protein BC358_08275 [Hydrogenophaga sp. H7]|nr:hypothetical protein BC358_08275 [Hydrogenophaga sp. H7]
MPLQLRAKLCLGEVKGAQFPVNLLHLLIDAPFVCSCPFLFGEGMDNKAEVIRRPVSFRQDKAAVFTVAPPHPARCLAFVREGRPWRDQAGHFQQVTRPQQTHAFNVVMKRKPLWRI